MTRPGSVELTRLFREIEPSIRLARAEGVSLERFLRTQHAHAPLWLSRDALALMLGAAVIRWLELDAEES